MLTFNRMGNIKYLHSDGGVCLVLYVAPFVELQQGVVLTLQLIEVTLQSLKLDTTKIQKQDHGDKTVKI